MATIANLTIEIKGTDYSVSTFLAADNADRVVRLEKEGGSEVYDVTEGVDRTRCTCKDFQFRHADLPYSDGCKHVKALVSFGLIRNVMPYGDEAEEVAEVEPDTAEYAPAGDATQAERSEAETEATTYAEGLSHTIAELTSEPAEQVAAGEDNQTQWPAARHRVKRGRPRKEANQIDWSTFGRRFAAGESYRKLAKEAGVPATRLYDRIKELGYSPAPAPAFAGV